MTIFLLNENTKGHVWDQCCHLEEANGASLGIEVQKSNLALSEFFLKLVQLLMLKLEVAVSPLSPGNGHRRAGKTGRLLLVPELK